MEGYRIMADAAYVNSTANALRIFVQAGVGSLAGAMVGYFANKYKDNPPKMIIRGSRRCCMPV